MWAVYPMLAVPPYLLYTSTSAEYSYTDNILHPCQLYTSWYPMPGLWLVLVLCFRPISQLRKLRLREGKALA